MQWHAFRGSGVNIALSPGTNAPCGPCQPFLATGTLPGKAGQEARFDCCCKPHRGAVPPRSGALLPERWVPGWERGWAPGVTPGSKPCIWDRPSLLYLTSSARSLSSSLYVSRPFYVFGLLFDPAFSSILSSRVVCRVLYLLLSPSLFLSVVRSLTLERSEGARERGREVEGWRTGAIIPG